MPCTAKKYEASRAELSQDNIADVDISITTRELARMIKKAGIDFVNLENTEFDNPMGDSTGAANIFGATGGVLEAALRTAYEWVTDKELDKVEFLAVRGIDGIKEATINIDGTDINVCVANTLGNAKKVMEEVRSGNSKYHIIEIMACPGGCVGGAGQPLHHGNFDIVKKRIEGLYSIDKNKAIRKSHKNPSIISLYEDFLGEPYGDIAHELLHTNYYDKSNTYACE